MVFKSIIGTSCSCFFVFTKTASVLTEGSTSYLSQSDSPFIGQSGSPFPISNLGVNFYTEDFEDSVFAPG